MMPTKNASSDMNSADKPRNETTRLSALATGFRLRTTAAPKITVSTAKIQNRKGDIFQATDEHGSNTDVNRNPKFVIILNPWLLLFFVPFENHAVHHSAVHSVILNEVKDLSSQNSGSWTLHLLWDPSPSLGMTAITFSRSISVPRHASLRRSRGVFPCDAPYRHA